MLQEVFLHNSLDTFPWVLSFVNVNFGKTEVVEPGVPDL